MPFLVNQVGQIEGALQNLLKMGAFLSNTFDKETLAHILEVDQLSLDPLLEKGIEHGFLVRVETPEKRCYGFAHDRIQEVCYGLEPPSRRKETHLHIGKKLLLLGEEGENLFKALYHLNGASGLLSEEERLHLSRLNLQGGQSLKQEGAFQGSLVFLKKGCALLPQTIWEEDYELSFALHLEKAESEYLSENFEEAQKSLEDLMEKVKDNIDRTRVCNLKIILLRHLDRYQESLAVGIGALKDLGVHLSLKPSPLAILRELLSVRMKLWGKKPEDILTLPEASDKRGILLMEILAQLESCAFMVGEGLFALILLKEVNLSLQYGNSRYSSLAYMGYGVVLRKVFENYEKAYQWGEASLKLGEQFGDKILLCRLYFVFGQFMLGWTKHCRLTLEYCERSYQTGLEAGEFIYASVGRMHSFNGRFFMGDSLDEMERDLKPALQWLHRMKMSVVEDALRVTDQTIRALKGETRDLSSLEDGNFSEEDFIHQYKQISFQGPLAYYYVNKLQLLYLSRKHREAWKLIQKNSSSIKFIWGEFKSTEHYFYSYLHLIQLSDQGGWREKYRIKKFLSQFLKKIKHWSIICPENFLHRYLLMEAERARIKGSFK